MEQILVLAVMAAIVVVGVLAIRAVTRRLFGPRRRLEELMGIEALDARLERGDITREEYDRARRALTAQAGQQGA